MESLKNNIDNISDDTQKLVNDYMKMFTVRQSEKFALFLGIIATAFILTMLLLVIVVEDEILSPKNHVLSRK